MDHNSGAGPGAYECELREQDRWLPIANVARLMKGTLPGSAKVSKDAKECMQECVSEFISFITSEASERCFREKRKTINGEDILYSMHDLGFENYAEVLKIYLAKYREQQALKQERGETRTSRRQRAVAAATANAVEIESGLHNGTEPGITTGPGTGTGTTIDSQIEESPLEGHSESSSNDHLSAPPPEEVYGKEEVGLHKDEEVGMTSESKITKDSDHELMEESHYIDQQQRHSSGPEYYEANHYIHRSEAKEADDEEENHMDDHIGKQQEQDQDHEQNDDEDHDEDQGHEQEDDDEVDEKADNNQDYNEPGTIQENNNDGGNEDSYEYTDFMGAGHHNIDEFTKLTNEEADMDVLSAEITNGNGGDW